MRKQRLNREDLAAHLRLAGVDDREEQGAGGGVGVVGETSFFFDFDDWFDPGSFSHRTIRCQTSDLTTVGGVPQPGGVDLTHIWRAPVMGPFVRASAFNEDDKAHNVQVLAYLST